jgi:hypothetical protein
MSMLYQEIDPPMKDLKSCPECGGPITQDIFQIQTEKRKRLIEARACEFCKIIYEIITD